MTVVTTAPSYLFWRCAPPELRVPREFLAALGGSAAAARSRSARTARRRPERAAQARRRRRGARRVRGGRRRARRTPAISARVPLDRLSATATAIRVTGGPPAAALHRPAGAALAGRVDRAAPPPPPPLRRGSPSGPGAEVEASRGCPYHCTLLRQDRFPRQVSPPRPRAAAGRDRRADRAGRRATSTSSTRSSCRNRPLLEALVDAADRSSACRPASICGSPTCSTCSARAGCVSIEAASRA